MSLTLATEPFTFGRAPWRNQYISETSSTHSFLTEATLNYRWAIITSKRHKSTKQHGCDVPHQYYSGEPPHTKRPATNTTLESLLAQNDQPPYYSGELTPHIKRPATSTTQASLHIKWATTNTALESLLTQNDQPPNILLWRAFSPKTTNHQYYSGEPPHTKRPATNTTLESLLAQNNQPPYYSGELTPHIKRPATSILLRRAST